MPKTRTVDATNSPYSEEASCIALRYTDLTSVTSLKAPSYAQATNT